jgi:antitoxin (DNA-binding transcriptional repressor) of toxin-antitoxin stability system
MRMTKDVTVAELGEHLTERLGDVRRGTTLQVVDAGKTIARIEPVAISADEPFRPPQLKWDGAELIAIDRGNMREPLTFPDPSLGRLGDWTPPSLHLDWDPVEDLIAERNKHR